MRSSLDILSFFVATFSGMVAGWCLERGLTPQGYGIVLVGAGAFVACLVLKRIVFGGSQS